MVGSSKKKRARPGAARSSSTRKSGASRNRSNNAASTAAQPGRLRVMGTLLVAAIFVGALYYLAKLEVPQAPAAASRAPAAALPEHDFDTQYTFYTRLADFTIEPDDETEKRPASRTLYIIQAGSFKTREQAERRIVELKLLALDPRVDERVNSDGSRWQRVLLGPYDSRSRMAGVRNVLISNDIDGMVMRRREALQ